MKIKWKLYLYINLALVALSGFGIIILNEFFMQNTEYGPMSHPLLDEVKLLHYITCSFFVFQMGIIFESHVKKSLRLSSKFKRISGFLLIFLCFIQIMTGYLQFYIVRDLTLDIIQWVHIMSSSFFLVILCFHIWLKNRLK